MKRGSGTHSSVLKDQILTSENSWKNSEAILNEVFQIHCEIHFSWLRFGAHVWVNIGLVTN